jgi:release factor glutamine methyltransferase
VDAELIAAHVIGTDRVRLGLYLRNRPNPEQYKAFWQAVSLRRRRIPLQYVLGKAWFYGLELKIEPGVFIPRPETEALAQAVIDYLRSLGNEGHHGFVDEAQPADSLARPGARATRPSSRLVLDLCTGSGAVALAVAGQVPFAKVVAVDISEEAARLACCNASRLGLSERVSIVVADMDAALGPLADGLFDVVCANPPYVPTGDIPLLDPEVSVFEPHKALDGGGDGLAKVEAVLVAAARLLRDDGMAAVEIDDRCAEILRCDLRWRDFFDSSGFSAVEFLKDLSGRERILVARKTSVLDAASGFGEKLVQKSSHRARLRRTFRPCGTSRHLQSRRFLCNGTGTPVDSWSQVEACS